MRYKTLSHANKEMGYSSHHITTYSHFGIAVDIYALKCYICELNTFKLWTIYLWLEFSNGENNIKLLYRSQFNKNLIENTNFQARIKK